MAVDGYAERAGRRPGDPPRRRTRGGRPPGDRLPGAERGDPLARQRGDRAAGAARRRGARLPAQPDRARAQDEPLVHDRRADPRSNEPAVPAHPARHRGPARGGRLHGARGEHGQRPRARADRLPGDARSAGRRHHRRDRPPRPPAPRRGDGGRPRPGARQPPADESPISSATPDDREGIRLAVQHLVELGHKRIAHLAGPLDYSTGRDRHDGFLDGDARGGAGARPRA